MFRKLVLLLPLLLVWLQEQAFCEFITDDPDDFLLVQWAYLCMGLGLAACLWYWRRMERPVAWSLALVFGAWGALMLESYAHYGVPMVYMHVYAKILVLLTVYGAYGFYHQRGLPPLGWVVAITFGVFALNMAIKHPESLSLSGFLANERGLLAPSALLLVLPTVLCLNWFLQRGSLLMLGLFFAGLGTIVLMQHRSVWLTTIMALAVDVALLKWRVVSARFSTQRMVLLVVLPLLLGSMGGAATLLDDPHVIRKFEQSFEDIANPHKQGTGEWRIKQMHAYQPLVAERPVLGWRLDGFELPMQFYDPSNDQPMWAWHTGHHFHSFYMDRLFYFGWVGLLLTVVPLFVVVIRRLAHPAPFSAESAACLSLLAGLLVFGLSYDWPFHIYAVVGLAMAACALPPPRQLAPAPAAAPVQLAQAELVGA